MQKQQPDFIVGNEYPTSDSVSKDSLSKQDESSPKMSIIIPVYNVEKYLRECLDSVVNQTLREIEIICIDDGSTDTSLEILKEYRKTDGRITVFTQKNQKQGAARNKGLKAAKGEYIFFVDSDDYIDLKACENLYNKCKALDLDMLCYRGTNFDNISRENLGNPYYEFKYLPSNWDKSVFNYRDCLPFLPKMAVTTFLTVYKRAFILSRNIIFPEKIYFEDNVFFIKSITQAQRVSIDKNLYYYRRIHEKSTTQNWNNHFADYLKVVEIIINYLRDADIDSKLYSIYRPFYLGTAQSIYEGFSHQDQMKYYNALNMLKMRYSDTVRKTENIFKLYLLFPIYLFELIRIRRRIRSLIAKK